MSRGSGTKTTWILLSVPVLKCLFSRSSTSCAVLVRHAALHALVDEVERAIERDADPHEPPLDHLVEVAGERLQDGLAHVLRQLGLEPRLQGVPEGGYLRARGCGLVVAARDEHHDDANQHSQGDFGSRVHHLVPVTTVIDGSRILEALRVPPGSPQGGRCKC